MSHAERLDQVRQYYDGKLAAHGPTPAGVDWNSFDSQQLRFRQLEELWHGQPDASLIDYGCGYGALAAYLRSNGHRGPYAGFDLSDAMVEAARAHTAALADCRFVTRLADLSPADFAVASGVFNVKLAADEATWSEYVRGALHDLSALGARGFAFNALTSYSDPGRRRPDLFYADPRELFDYCVRTFSRRVRLVHDYPLFEFTIIVRR